MDVIIVDDQPLCLDILSQIVKDRYSTASIRTASDIGSALVLTGEKAPDLVIADLGVGGPGAEPGLKQLVDHARPGPVLTLDARLHPCNLKQARRAGAFGYLPKTSSRPLIEAAIALVAAGGVYFPEGGQDAAPSTPHATLSRRQMQVLEGLMRGKSNREIAEDLGIAVATVKLHVHAILTATGSRNRTEAALLARDVLRAGT